MLPIKWSRDGWLVIAWKRAAAEPKVAAAGYPAQIVSVGDSTLDSKRVAK